MATHHGVEIGESNDKGRGLSEPLLEGVAEVVSRVGGDDEDGGTNPSEKDREDRATGGLADAALPPDENPLERILIQDILHSRFLQLRRHCLRTE